MIDPVSIITGAVVGAVVGGVVVSTIMKGAIAKNAGKVNEEAERAKQRILDEGRAENAKAKADMSENLLKRRNELDGEFKKLQDEQRSAEKRLERREDLLDKKLSVLERKEQEIERGEAKRKEHEKLMAEQKAELEKMIGDERHKLQKISGLTQDQAKKMLLERVEADCATEAAEISRRAIGRAKEKAQIEARKITLNIIQRIASDFVAENTVSTIDLPKDDMKGRIIGREGRNIRAFEKATGVDVIVDETPGVVVLSGFEPIRREIARLAMEKLIADGRIHPTRIEESVAKAKEEVEGNIEKTGQDVAIEFGCHDLHPKLCNLLGRLRYRTSYGQNVLAHVQEVGHICGMLAGELKLDVQLAKRCGLLHDCGKAIDQEQEGTHPELGMAIAQQVGERVEVCEAIGGHHGDIEIHSLYPIVVQVADAISAARPGARRESLEKYLTRMKRLEEIATERKGIDKAFAIQAGREVRVLAKADQLKDSDCMKVAQQIAKQIEDELNYPGEVKITLIRESRFVEYAR